MGDDDHMSTIEKLTRAGWLAKGLVFIVIGLLAAGIARDATRADADKRGALGKLVDQPAGRVLVTAVGIGLLLFAAWQVLSAIRDESTDAVGIVGRIGGFGLGLAYALLASTAVRIAMDPPEVASAGGEGGPTSPDELSARLLDLPMGPWLVGVVGGATIAVGLHHAQKGLRLRFVDDIDVDDLPAPARVGLEALGLLGYVARAFVLVIVGWLFIDAAVNRDPDRAAGLDEALRSLQQASYGEPLLMVAAGGLFGAGLYDMVTFRRRRLE